MFLDYLKLAEAGIVAHPEKKGLHLTADAPWNDQTREAFATLCGNLLIPESDSDAAAAYLSDLGLWGVLRSIAESPPDHGGER